MTKRLPIQRQTAQGSVVGRPRKDAPADAAKRIKELASRGVPIGGVAACMGVGRDLLRQWFDEDPELLVAFERGREEERDELHVLLRKQARAGNPIAAMFLLKARHSYREGDPGEQPSRLTVTFNMPGAQTKEAFLASVLAEQDPKDE